MKQRLRRVYVRLLRAPGAPREVAMGMAIGLFVALVPVAQTAIALGVVEIFRRVSGIRASHVAAAAGTWLTNPLTAVPLYALSLFVGRPVAHLVLGADRVGPGAVQAGFLDPAVLETVLSFGAGNVLVGAPIAAIGYALTRWYVARYQARRAAKKLERQRIAA